MILIYTSPGYLLGGKRINHPITGPTVELYAKYPAAQHPRWQRLVSLTIPQEARQRLAEFLGASPPYPEAPGGARSQP
jgi:hypothetical protein